MSRITVGCKLSNNATNWTRPTDRDGSSFVTENRYGFEDWNFRTDQVVDGYLYGFTQAVPREGLRSSPVDVLLYTIDEAGAYRAVGLYLAAEYLEEAEATKLARSKAWRSILEARKGDFLREYGNKAGEEMWSEYAERDWQFNWRVRPESVVNLADWPTFDPGYAAHRDGTPYYFQDRSWQEIVGRTTVIDADAPNGLTTIEGRVIDVTHTARERDVTRSVRVKKARRAAGTLQCDACSLDFGARFGSVLADLLEAHHTQPLGTLEDAGAPVRDEDIALLCPTCHRLAHRTRRFDLASLKSFLDAHPA